MMYLWVVVIIGMLVLAGGFVILSIHNGKSYAEDISLYDETYQPGRVVDHRDVMFIEEYLHHHPEVVQGIAETSWFFAHGSLGVNILDGMEALHKENPELYPLVVRVISPSVASKKPADVVPGTIYAVNRGNPDESAKRELFETFTEKGWGRQVTAVMNKLSYTDRSDIDAKLDWDENIRKANDVAEYYRYTMVKIQLANPELKVVSTTMPLTAREVPANFMRYAFNQELRRICGEMDTFLLDIADVESCFPDGTPNRDVHNPSGVMAEQLVELYSTDGGHMNSDGKRRLAKAWYAMAASITLND
ncbi:MAG: hypothetical protein FWG40_04785 [Peptococcaceae bacterium]|nr:hypothetical protein [Peptococcaceae bacterium]